MSKHFLKRFIHVLRSPPLRSTTLHLTTLEDRTVPTTYTVTSSADSGAGSLRQAISDANGNSGADDIVFGGAFSGTIVLGSALDITDSVTITGLTTGVLIDAQNASRIFNVDKSGTTLTVTLEYLNLMNGSVTGNGGNIFNAETLTLIDCNVNAGFATGNGWTLTGSHSNHNGKLSSPQSPGLNGLASNGGPTQTFSVQITSVGRNQGSNLLSLTTDQRGGSFVREYRGFAADIGAFESVEDDPN